MDYLLDELDGFDEIDEFDEMDDMSQLCEDSESFLERLWANAMDPDKKMTVEEAANDLRTFRNEWEGVPEDLTAEEMAAWWNAKVDEFIGNEMS